MVECWSEALCRDKRFDEVTHHVDLRLFLLIFLLILIQLRLLASAARLDPGGGKPTAAGTADGSGRGPSTAKLLPLAPDDRVVKQVEVCSGELADQLD